LIPRQDQEAAQEDLRRSLLHRQGAGVFLPYRDDPEPLREEPLPEPAPLVLF
jgi:hypothetical protein